MNFMRRMIIKLKDNVRYSSLTKRIFLLAMVLLSWVPQTDKKKARLLARAFEVAKNSPLRSFFGKKLDPFINGTKTDLWEKCRIGWDKYPQAFSKTPITNSIILKTPKGKNERGVLLIQGEYNWLKVFKNTKAVQYLNSNYFIVLSTGWSPTDYTLLGLICSSACNEVFVQACNYDEINALEEFSPKINCLQSIGCDWINPDFYYPKPFARREIDILMVAAWGPYKRHWQLFQALKKMPKHLRVALIGQPIGRYTVDWVRKQAALFGVRQEIEFIDRVSVEKVSEYQCNSKISVILTRHEGCCVAISESLFADSPVAALRGADVGSVLYINKDTGVLLNAGKIHYQLQQFLETGEEYRARAWAIERISYTKSHQKLNALIKDFTMSKGLSWTADLKPVCYHPLWAYVSEKDRQEMGVAYNDLHEKFPDVF